MPRKRMIDPSLWTDEGMAELTPRQQLLYIGLFSNADDDGRIRGSPSSVRLILPTVYGGIGLGDVAADLHAVLEQMRQLRAYEHDGRQYLVFENYPRWQKIEHPSASSLPPPPDFSPNGRTTFTEASPNAPRTVAEDAPSVSGVVDERSPGNAPSLIRLEEEKLVEESLGQVRPEGRESRARARGAAAAAAVCVPAEEPTEDALPDPVKWVWDFYLSEIQPDARLCPRRQILARLETFTVDDLTVGIQNFRDDAWCMDHNRTRGGAWFFKSDERSQQFLTMEPRSAPLRVAGGVFG